MLEDTRDKEHEELDLAVMRYLAKGGKIKKLMNPVEKKAALKVRGTSSSSNIAAGLYQCRHVLDNHVIDELL